MNAMLLETVFEAPVRLSGSNCQQPAAGFERVEQFEHAGKQRLLNGPGLAQLHEGALIILGELNMLLERSLREKLGHGFNKAKADDAPRVSWQWNGMAIGFHALCQRCVDGRVAIDERAVAIEDRQSICHGYSTLRLLR